MPIRMVDDPQDPNEFNDNNQRRNTGGNSGGGGGLMNFLPLLLTLFRSKLGLGLLVVAAILYFTVGKEGCGGLTNMVSKFTTGGMLSPAEFSKAPVYEGLSDDDVKNPLPEYVSLAKFAPPRQNQGQQGSCVAWSSAYAAQSILYSAANGKSPVQNAFSPSFMYNQIGLDGCQGSYIIRAVEFMQKRGGVHFNEMPYTDQNCSQQPTAALNQQASQNKILGYNRLTTSEDPNGLNIRAIKEHLAKDAPVIIGMMVGGSFMDGMMGQKLWQPTNSDYQQMGFGGHAMCVIGYDDKLAGGAFQIMNSWGPEWGENGIGWVKYSDFIEFTREAYGVNALQKQGDALNKNFDCEIGLMQVDDKAKPTNYIPLKNIGANTFESALIKRGIRFKVEVKNSTECYVYVFGRENDGSSYTLFPYPSDKNPQQTAYSAYCGITGYRLFPKNKSMTPDDSGNRDYMSIVVSKQELDWYKLNQSISANKANYKQAVATALNGASNISVSATGSGNLKFTAPAGTNGVAYAIIEVNKQ